VIYQRGGTEAGSVGVAPPLENQDTYGNADAEGVTPTMTGFGTQTDTMLQASRHVADVNEQVGAQLRTLGSQLTPLESAWRGMAATSFHQLMIRFNENAEKLRTALQGISEQIAGAGTTYATEDETQQQAMSNITNALG